MQILFHDDNITAVIKEVGMDSEKDLPRLLEEKYGTPFYTVHRLDKNVGGVMVYAGNKESAAKLSHLIQNSKMIKEYVAKVHGTPDEHGFFEDLLFKDSKKNKVYVVDRLRKGVKSAKLEYWTLIKGETSLVRIRLYTGRSHQIRVQFASRKFSLLGDKKYGAKDEFSAPFLYSSKITFPYKNETVTFESLPDWAK